MNVKMIVFYIIGGIVVLLVFIYVTGLLLPTERVVNRKGKFNVSPEILYNIVTDNAHWQYRSALKDLVILYTDINGMEIWNEISHDGTVIHFQTREKRPYSFYSFDMETRMFTGYWTGEFEADSDGGTIFTATEHIRIRNPFVKILSYLFFDIGKLMDEYQHDLRKKTAGIAI